MDAWGVFGVIAALVTFGVCVGAPLLKLNATITKLQTTLDILVKQFNKQCEDNENEHNSLWERADEQGKTINEHETRISVLEHAKGGD